jgi:colanic acid/amylovoran biosynthesis glycosyltransferase
MKSVLIYRNELLPPSETFIRAQAGMLRRYRPQMIGLREVDPSLLVPETTLLCERESRLPSVLRRSSYEACGVLPALHANCLMHRLNALEPSLLHAHFATDATMAVPLARALRIPLVVTLHGYDVTAARNGRNLLRRWLGMRQRERLWTYAILFLCVSEFIRQRAITAGFPADKLIVHRIGINLDVFRPAEGLARSNDVVFVGRLTEKKGCAFLLQAMQLVQQRLPQARLLVVGDGPLRAQLEALAKELQVDCSFLGRQPHEQVIATLANARVCAIPSVTAANGDSEGLPMILAEAQGLGVPVVATRHAGIPEGIVDGEGGLLSDERDARSLAMNILRLFEDEELYTSVRRRGAELVLREFDLKRQTERLEAIYDGVLSGRPDQGKVA